MCTTTFRAILRLAFFFASLCAVLLLVPNFVRAAAIVIDDTSPAEVIVISVNDFEFGFNVNGAQIQIGLNNPGSVTVPETGPINFNGSWIAPGVTGTFERTIYLIEPDPTPAPLVSDIIRYVANFTGSLGTIQGTFESDLEGNLPPLPSGVDPADVFVENGQPVLFELPFLSGRIMSDVPEPSTLALLGLGFVSLVGWRLRQRFA